MSPTSVYCCPADALLYLEMQNEGKVQKPLVIVICSDVSYWLQRSKAVREFQVNVKFKQPWGLTFIVHICVCVCVHTCLPWHCSQSGVENTAVAESSITPAPWRQVLTVTDHRENVNAKFFLLRDIYLQLFQERTCTSNISHTCLISQINPNLQWKNSFLCMH